MAEARVDLVLYNSQFVQGMSQADAAQKRFANNWEAIIGRIFKRSPFARAERAISEFAVLLGSGNLAGAFAALGSRVTGLGLGVGVALGAGIALFKKFSAQAKESALAVSAIHKELGVPLSIQGSLGPGITGVIDRQTNLLDDLIKKRQTFGGKIADALNNNVPDPNRETDITSFNFKTGRIRRVSAAQRAADSANSSKNAQLALEERIGELIQKRAQYEEQISNLKSRELTGDKLSASLEQNRLQFETARAEVIDRALKEARLDAFQQMGSFVALQRILSGLTNLRNAQGVSAQRDVFQKSVHGFNPRSAAVTEDFLREKIAADPFAPGVAQMRLQADQLNLFRQNAKLEELKDLEQNSIAYGPGARLFQQRNRDAIADQQQRVMDQSNRVMKEQSDVSGNSQVVGTLIEIRNKMDAYWK